MYICIYLVLGDGQLEAEEDEVGGPDVGSKEVKGEQVGNIEGAAVEETLLPHLANHQDISWSHLWCILWQELCYWRGR